MSEDERVEVVARALYGDEYDDQEFPAIAEACRAQARAVLAALDARGGPRMNDGPVERRYNVERIRHRAVHQAGGPSLDESYTESVEDFCFVLRPERDPHAAEALAAYADACEPEFPQLAADLRRRLADIEYAETRHALRAVDRER